MVDINIDTTTYYSMLGVSTTSSTTNIHKSYLKLARLLHPDKSNSEQNGELFKHIVQAHSILTDENKKSQYDRLLIVQGLFDYIPRSNCHHFKEDSLKDSDNSDVTEKIHSLQSSKSKYTRKGRSYENQPYGFGNESISVRENISASKAFRLKKHQRDKHRTVYEREEKHESVERKSFSTERSKNKSEMTTSENISRHESLENLDSTNDPISNAFSDSSFMNGSLTNDTQTQTYPSKNLNGSSARNTPDPDLSDLKQHDQTLNDTEQGEKRENNNHYDHTDNEQRSKFPKTDNYEFESNNLNHSRAGFMNSEERRYARTKSADKSSSSRPISPISTSNLFNGNANWDTLKDIINKLSEQNENGQEENKYMKHGQEGSLKGSPEITKSSFKGMRNKNKRSSLSSSEINLKDIADSLSMENEDISFDMLRVDEELDSIPLFKRQKLTKNAYQHFSKYPDDISQPVNPVLPRVYQTNPIPLNKYCVDLNTLELELPDLPNFPRIDKYDTSEIEILKDIVRYFNSECNKLKSIMLNRLQNRFLADENLNNRILQIENIGNWRSCINFDQGLMHKFNILQERQALVAQKLAEIMDFQYVHEIPRTR